MTVSTAETTESALEISIEGDGTMPHRDGAVDPLDGVDCSCEFDATAGAHRVSLYADERTVRPSTAVVEVIAALAGRRPEELEPLYATVDPDALDTLLRRADGDGGGERAAVSISFAYAGYEITLYGG